MWVLRKNQLCPHLVIAVRIRPLVVRAMYKAARRHAARDGHLVRRVLRRHHRPPGRRRRFMRRCAPPSSARRAGAPRRSASDPTGLRAWRRRRQPDGLLRLPPPRGRLLHDEPVRTARLRPRPRGEARRHRHRDVRRPRRRRREPPPQGGRAEGGREAARVRARRRPAAGGPRPERKSVGAQASWGVRFESDEGAEVLPRPCAAGGRTDAAGRRRQGGRSRCCGARCATRPPA